MRVDTVDYDSAMNLFETEETARKVLQVFGNGQELPVEQYNENPDVRNAIDALEFLDVVEKNKTETAYKFKSSDAQTIFKQMAEKRGWLNGD